MTAKSCLIFHPDTPESAVREFYIGVKADFQDNELLLRYELTGALGNLLIPEPQPPTESDGLWRHMCFEAFVAVVEDETCTRYHEFNFSPSGLWAAYAFSNYRQRKAWQASDSPDIRCDRSGDLLSLEIAIKTEDLPHKAAHQPYRLGLSAVLESTGGELSYWALCHPGGSPDFHHRRGFTLSLNPA